MFFIVLWRDMIMQGDIRLVGALKNKVEIEEEQW